MKHNKMEFDKNIIRDQDGGESAQEYCERTYPETCEEFKIILDAVSYTHLTLPTTPYV